MSKIVLDTRIDRVDFAEKVAASEPVIVQAQMNYNGFGDGVVDVDITLLGSDEKEAYLKVIDYATWQKEEDALIWKIKRTGKTFDLSTSYVRDTISTGGTLTDISAGTPLKMHVEIPGFSSNTLVTIDLWYDQDFDTADIDLLKDQNIDLTGNGSSFTIDNLQLCKIYFSKPTSVTTVDYVIDFNSEDKIVEI